jgi:hypothetical protein
MNSQEVAPISTKKPVIAVIRKLLSSLSMEGVPPSNALKSPPAHLANTFLDFRARKGFGAVIPASHRFPQTKTTIRTRRARVLAQKHAAGAPNGPDHWPVNNEPHVPLVRKQAPWPLLTLRFKLTF